MKHEIKKVSRILDELVTFCLNHGTENMKMSLESQEDCYKIQLEIDTIDCTDKRVKKLKKFLEGPRQTEIEEYYWELAGENDHDDELFLIGAMVDKAEVTFNGNALSIVLYRKK